MPRDQLEQALVASYERLQRMVSIQRHNLKISPEYYQPIRYEAALQDYLELQLIRNQ